MLRKESEAHGGTISIESVPGEGTTLRFQIPSAPATLLPATSDPVESIRALAVPVTRVNSRKFLLTPSVRPAHGPQPGPA